VAWVLGRVARERSVRMGGVTRMVLTDRKIGSVVNGSLSLV
jgi:hypothetical protein